MKRTLLKLAFVSILIFGSASFLRAQQEPQPKKDSVNMDTIIKPTYYYAVEDETSESNGNKGGSASRIIIIVAAVIIVGGIVISLTKKK
ncbi:MAG TPA: hypothetical protein PLN06_08635 [Bacteroidales bacterium]|nr:hypothetical protein [Bacteroidales bacterium]